MKTPNIATPVINIVTTAPSKLAKGISNIKASTRGLLTAGGIIVLTLPNTACAVITAADMITPDLDTIVGGTIEVLDTVTPDITDDD